MVNDILDGIGSTEALHIFISNSPDDIRAGSSGRMVPGYNAKIVDDSGEEVSQGEEGRLLIRGDSTCKYYWNNSYYLDCPEILHGINLHFYYC